MTDTVRRQFPMQQHIHEGQDGFLRVPDFQMRAPRCAPGSMLYVYHVRKDPVQQYSLLPVRIVLQAVSDSCNQYFLY